MDREDWEVDWEVRENFWTIMAKAVFKVWLFFAILTMLILLFMSWWKGL